MEHNTLLPTHDSRSDEVATMARQMQNQRLDIKEEQVRGVELGNLLGSGAQLFADGGKAAQENPHGTFALSRPVRRLDYFVSHAWRSSRFAKWAALCAYYNMQHALAMYLAVGMGTFVIQTLFYEQMPSFILISPQEQKFIDNRNLRASMAVQCCAGIALALTFAFGHRVFRRGETAFLDIACIDQCDATTKAAGINSLGALLDRSRRMVVLLDENNMKRMWCVFEVAAFAKRRSIEKMDLVPVPLALQQAALVASTALTPLMALMMTADEMIGENIFVWILFTIPLMAPPMLLLIHATAAGHVTARALDDLQDFTMAAAECYSPVDRAAIVNLIGQWFADEGEGVDVGLHNFEMFVRMEVHAKVEEALGRAGAPQWPAILSVLWFLQGNGAWFLDESCPPEVTLWELLSALSASLAGLFAAPVFGYGISVTAALVQRAHAGCCKGCGYLASLVLVGVPGVALSMFAYVSTTTVVVPYAFVAGSDSLKGNMTFPDDGFDDWPRRVMKVQVVALVAMTFVAIYTALMRTRA